MLDPTGPLSKSQPEDLIENTCCRLVLKGTSTHTDFFIVTLLSHSRVYTCIRYVSKAFAKTLVFYW